MSEDTIQQRKQDHLRIVGAGDASHARTTLLECVELTHCALPEAHLADIDTSVEFYGHRLSLPLMITSMTGGTERAGELNRSLASAAAACGIAFAVGSQRVMLRHPDTATDFEVRNCIPDGVLLGNIGGQQLHEYDPGQVISLVNRIEADGICIHLNPAHELAQPEGDKGFAGILDGITAINELLEGRVLVKEVGHGISGGVFAALQQSGIRCIDIAGSGGTSWTRAESLRPGGSRIGEAFADWGIPTARALLSAAVIAAEDTTLIASGGIRSGIDIARATALGADLCGMAQPVLSCWLEGGQQGVVELISGIGEDLRTAMLLTGSRDLAALAGCDRYIAEPLISWVSAKLDDGK